MKKNNNTYHVYTDGSANIGKQEFGASAILRHETKSKKFRRLSSPLTPPQNSFTAEANSIILALGKLPEGSTVHIHTDHKNIAETFSAPLPPLDTFKNKSRETWGSLIQATSRHTSVSFNYTSAQDSGYMQEAHNLAQLAAQNNLEMYKK